MTRLLSLFNQVFGDQSKSYDLEHFINSRNLNSHQQVEELTRNYLYHLTTPRGL